MSALAINLFIDNFAVSRANGLGVRDHFTLEYVSKYSSTQISALMKKHNFSAGPSILDESVIRDAASAVLNYQGTGLSILEVSHRAKEFSATMEEARNIMKELLDIPEGYEVLFLGGGASLQFAQVPMNLLKK